MAFACAGIAAGVVALAVDRRVLREPLGLVLLALAAFGALSALWTLGPEERTLRWAGVTLGYAGVFYGAAVAARTSRGRVALAAGIGVIAAVAGAVGLVALAAHDHPYALRIDGDWRVAGPFEYPPALALLMASALPVFIAALRSGRLLKLAGISGIALSAAVLLLADSRIGLALGIGIAGFVALRPSPRVAVAGIAAALVIGSVAFGSGGSFLHGREDTWRAAIETFADEPVHGVGADAFLAGSARHQEGAAILFAHDLPLEFAAELGILGLLLALALYGATARLAWRGRREWLFMPAAVAFPLANLLDWPWHLAGAGAVWALAAGALSGSVSNLGPPSPKTEGDK